jgi:hypothetical protein
MVAFGKRIGHHPLLLGAGLALSMAASYGPPAPVPAAPPPAAPSAGNPAGPPPDVPHLPSLFAYRAAAAAPSAPYVGVIGDSTGSQLVKPLADLLNPHGVGVVGATMGGCQASDVDLMYISPEYYDRHRYCAAGVKVQQGALTAQFHPKVVLWADIMEWSDIKANNQLVKAGTDRWRQLMKDSWDRIMARLGNAAVVLILPTWWAGYPTDSPAPFPVERQRALFRDWAARHRDRVTVVDLGPVICPSGPPCQQVVNGVQLRSDHVHYTPEGMRRAIAAIMAGAPVLRNLAGPGTTSVPAK